MSVLDNEDIRNGVRQAWADSQPGTADGHEEGGYILRNSDQSLTIERWPRGQQDQIVVPSHSGGMRNGLRIVATFHTHPNTGPDYQQEPGLTDIRAVRNDSDLHSAVYEGEYVIANDLTYRILSDGSVEVVGRTSEVLA